MPALSTKKCDARTAQGLAPYAQVVEHFHEVVGIPAAPVNGVRDAVFGDLATARGLRIEADGIPMIASPLRMSATPMTEPVRPPYLGEHADAICAEVGFDAHALKSNGAIR